MDGGCWKVDEDDQGPSFYKRDKNHRFSHELWNEMYSSKNTGSKAIYIDLEDGDDGHEEHHQYSRWSDLPDLVLEHVLSHLSMRERYYASLVCKSWYRAFRLPGVWREFVLGDSTLTRGRFNYYSGWQYVLDHMRTQSCLIQVSRHFRRLVFEPMLNFYNLYEFMNMISWCCAQAETEGRTQFGDCRNIRALKYTFPCKMSTDGDESEQVRLFGTGGKLLEALKTLMGHLRQLSMLQLVDLMLDAKEAQHLLDQVAVNCHLTLRTLHIVNTTKLPYEILHVGVFLNLHTLVIAPQNLGDSAVELLGHTTLKHLHILQNRHWPSDTSPAIAVSKRAWKECRTNNPALRVHLRIEGTKEKPLVWQEGAPAATVLYNSPHIGVKTDAIMRMVDLYKRTLRTYGHLSVPRFHRTKSFHGRIDGDMVMLVRQCKFLTNLVINERISTSTCLLLAFTGKNLKCLHIRRNAVIIRCEWPCCPEWTDEFYKWLKVNSRSYEAVEREVSQILGYRWQFVSDKMFHNIKLNLHDL